MHSAVALTAAAVSLMDLCCSRNITHTRCVCSEVLDKIRTIDSLSFQRLKKTEENVSTAEVWLGV